MRDRRSGALNLDVCRRIFRGQRTVDHPRDAAIDVFDRGDRIGGQKRIGAGDRFLDGIVQTFAGPTRELTDRVRLFRVSCFCLWRNLRMNSGVGAGRRPAGAFRRSATSAATQSRLARVAGANALS